MTKINTKNEGDMFTSYPQLISPVAKFPKANGADIYPYLKLIILYSFLTLKQGQALLLNSL